MMDNTQHRRLRTALTPLALALTLGNLPQEAYCQKDTASPSAMRQTRRTVKAKQDSLIQLRFDGGSLSQFLDVLRAAYASQAAKLGSNPHLNLIVTGSPATLVLPGFSLYDTTVQEALTAVERMTAAAKQRIKVWRNHDRGSRPIYVINASSLKDPRSATEGGLYTIITRVFSIRNLTTPVPFANTESVLPLEAVLGAVEAGLGLTSPKTGAQAPVVRYHKESGLLFVRADSRHAELVHEILQQLESALMERNNLIRNQQQKARRLESQRGVEKAATPKKRGTR